MFTDQLIYHQEDTLTVSLLTLPDGDSPEVRRVFEIVKLLLTVLQLDYNGTSTNPAMRQVEQWPWLGADLVLNAVCFSSRSLGFILKLCTFRIICQSRLCNIEQKLAATTSPSTKRLVHSKLIF